VKRTETPNYLRGIPNDWCQILKQQFSLCPMCKDNIRNEYHLSTAHGIDIHTYNEIWTEIKSYHDKTVEIHKKKKGDLEKVKRSKYLNFWGPRLKAYREDTEYKFKLVQSRNRT